VSPRRGRAATARGHRWCPRLRLRSPAHTRSLPEARPHTGPDVDPASGAEWVAFEDPGQLLEVDGHGPQHCRCAAAEQSIELVGQLIIPDPIALPKQNNEPASEFRGSFNALHDGGDQTLTSELQRAIEATAIPEQLDNSRSVAAVYRPPQGGSLLVEAHLPRVV
jgi:hypothetical protein